MNKRIQSFIEYLEIPVSEFERNCGLSNGAVKNMGDNTRTSTLDKISKVYPQLNIIWLRTGTGEMLTSSTETRNIPADADASKGYVTYLLPQSAQGGSLMGFAEQGSTLQNCEAIISPIKDVDFAITVYGDSMSPEYASGSRVLIKKVDPQLFIDWGKVYVVDTPNGVIIKEIHKSDKEGYISCHSINNDPKFAPFDIPLSEVYGMYRVMMCLSSK